MCTFFWGRVEGGIRRIPWLMPPQQFRERSSASDSPTEKSLPSKQDQSKGKHPKRDAFCSKGPVARKPPHSLESYTPSQKAIAQNPKHETTVRASIITRITWSDVPDTSTEVILVIIGAYSEVQGSSQTIAYVYPNINWQLYSRGS